MEEEEKKKYGGDPKEMSFWDHLDDLRWTLMRIAIGLGVCMVLVFMNRHIVFDIIVFGPTSSDFILYRGLCYLGNLLHYPSLCIEPFSLHNLQNITVAGQFFTHVSTSFWFGFVLSFPWIIYQLWLFVRPALYENERSSITKAFSFSSILFFVGVLVGYLLVFPMTLKFMGFYQVSESVENIITLASYIDTLIVLVMGMGLVFQMPVLILILSRLGIVNKAFLRKYRRYAIVIILTLAAIVTPSPDPSTMLAASIPLLLLYEFSIYICKK
ncbi:MAG: twin-arginine translocase subunit TatC [Prevotellaceae bacterium]|jgi:sec-independent protein translocase protein TatC|nr:twin-arginine translocase subunit TatC [Prevotellaceae bacterium]